MKSTLHKGIYSSDESPVDTVSFWSVEEKCIVVNRVVIKKKNGSA